MFCVCVCFQVSKYKGILDNATQADAIVKEKYYGNREAMALLSKPEQDISSSLPPAGTLGAMASASPVSPVR